MHTIMVMSAGLVLLVVFLLLGLAIGRSRYATGTGALWFIPAWFIGAGVNLWIGTTHGYTVADELPIFALVFGPLAALAGLLGWRLRRF